MQPLCVDRLIRSHIKHVYDSIQLASRDDQVRINVVTVEPTRPNTFSVRLHFGYVSSCVKVPKSNYTIFIPRYHQRILPVEI